VIVEDGFFPTGMFLRETVGSETADSVEDWDAFDGADARNFFMVIQPLKQAIHKGRLETCHTERYVAYGPVQGTDARVKPLIGFTKGGKDRRNREGDD
jgi:hypothetical protein